MHSPDEAMIRAAEGLARTAHQGQTDKAGAPYVTHPQRVAGHARCRAAVEGLSGQEAAALIAAAWLHDVVEDADVQLQDVAALTNLQVAGLVDAVTKRSGEPPEAYYERIARAGRLAVMLKLSDMDDNTDRDRLAKLAPELRDRLVEKYCRGRWMLLASAAAATGGRSV